MKIFTKIENTMIYKKGSEKIMEQEQLQRTTERNSCNTVSKQIQLLMKNDMCIKKQKQEKIK